MGIVILVHDTFSEYGKFHEPILYGSRVMTPTQILADDRELINKKKGVVIFA